MSADRESFPPSNAENRSSKRFSGDQWRRRESNPRNSPAVAECPHPWKRAYDKRRAAKRHASALRRKYKTAGECRVYQCVCGAWHVSSIGSTRNKGLVA